MDPNGNWIKVRTSDGDALFLAGVDIPDEWKIDPTNGLTPKVTPANVLIPSTGNNTIQANGYVQLLASEVFLTASADVSAASDTFAVLASKASGTAVHVNAGGGGNLIIETTGGTGTVAINSTADMNLSSTFFNVAASDSISLTSTKTGGAGTTGAAYSTIHSDHLVQVTATGDLYLRNLGTGDVLISSGAGDTRIEGAAIDPSIGQSTGNVLTYSGGKWQGAAPAGGAPSGTAGGSLAGSYPNPTIASGVSLPGSPTTTTQSAGDNSTKVATTAYADAAVLAAVPSGVSMMWPGTTIPTGWVLQDGSSQLRAGTYAGIFAAIGTLWGSVDGTHFNLPDMGEFFPMGYKSGGATGGTVGGTGGAATHTHAVGTLVNSTSAVTGITGTNGTSSVSGVTGTNATSVVSGVTGTVSSHQHTQSTSYAQAAMDGTKFFAKQVAASSYTETIIATLAAAGSSAGSRVSGIGIGGATDANTPTWAYGAGSGTAAAQTWTYGAGSGTAAAQAWTQGAGGTAAAQTISGSTAAGSSLPPFKVVKFIIKL